MPRESSGGGRGQKSYKDAFLEVSKVANQGSTVGSAHDSISKAIGPTRLPGGTGM